MAGRLFSGQEVVAYVPTVREKFRKTGDREDHDEKIAKYGIEGAEEEEARRIEKFGDWLEG